MNVDAALDATVRERLLPDNRMEGSANILIFSNSDAASGVRNILKVKANGLEVGPILMGMGAAKSSPLKPRTPKERGLASGVCATDGLFRWPPRRISERGFAGSPPSRGKIWMATAWSSLPMSTGHIWRKPCACGGTSR